MELIKIRHARLTALCAVAPKSLSTLNAQVKTHEGMETELVRIQQQVSLTTILNMFDVVGLGL